MLSLVQDTGEGFAEKFAEVETEGEPIEFLYLRLKNPDSTKEHNAKVFQKMNSSFVRVLFNDASANKNANEIENEFLDYLQKFNETSLNRFYAI
jgi:hypothetical protein